jgi:hypothetical protein
MSKYYRALLTINNLIKLFKQRVLSDGGVVESEDCIVLDKEASLQLTPNGYSENKLHSIIPSDGSGDFEFTRNSAAMRVNANHVLEQACYNLISYSEGIISTYAINNYVTDAVVSIAGFDNSVYFGNNSLDRGIYKSISTTVVGSYYHFSFFIEMDDLGVPVIGQNSNSGDFSIIFNSNLIFSNHSLELVSGSTYLVKAFGIIQVAGNYFGIGKYTSQSARKFKVSGMQVTTGSNLKPYLKTTDRLNVPILDYSGGAICPSILLQKQSTNEIRSSNGVGVGWTKVPSSSASFVVTANADIAPDGKNTATLLTQCDGAVYRCATAKSIIGRKIVASLYLKANGNVTVKGDIGDRYSYAFNVTDQWQRFYIYCDGTLDAYSFLDIESPIGFDLSIWGCQLEEGTYPTSIITTLGTIVTRVGDVLVKTGISHLIGQTEGTIFFEGSVPSLDQYRITLTNGNSQDTVRLSFWNGNILGSFKGGNVVFNYGSTIVNTNVKVCLRYTTTTLTLIINGIVIMSDSVSFTPFSSPLDRINFYAFVPTLFFYGKIKPLKLFKTALTEAKCIEKTL